MTKHKRRSSRSYNPTRDVMRFTMGMATLSVAANTAIAGTNLIKKP